MSQGMSSSSNGGISERRLEGIPNFHFKYYLCPSIIKCGINLKISYKFSVGWVKCISNLSQMKLQRFGKISAYNYHFNSKEKTHAGITILLHSKKHFKVSIPKSSNLKSEPSKIDSFKNIQYNLIVHIFVSHQIAIQDYKQFMMTLV